jgi:ribonuclease R
MPNKTPLSIDLMSEVIGTVQGHRDGHGFLVCEGSEVNIYLPPNEMKTVMHRDTIKVRVLRFDRKGRPEGQVLDIIERRKVPIIGRLLHEGGAWLVVPEDRRFGQDILVSAKAIGGAEAGQVVAVELTEKPSLHSKPVGKVVEVLGGIDDPGMEIEIAVRKYEVPHVFSDDVLAQAAKLPEKIRPADRKGRIDLTDVPLVTIDGEDARDFDDAVYCEPACIGRAKKPDGWRLLVAIADVSHYVKPDEPLDRDAYERATSVYFPRRVIPMLPEKLSNGLCSLNPLVERLSMVCDMLITSEGDIHAYQFYPAIICSHARLTYTEVAAMIGNTRGPEAQRRSDVVPHLLNLYDVYRALLKSRAQRGAVDFETTETQIVCDDNGRIAKIIPRVRTEAHRLIEEAMLAANVCSAEFIEQASHPAMYRVHEGPTPEKKQILRNYIKALGIGLTMSEDPKPGDFQAIAQATKDRPDALQIHTMLLRSMQQAIYTPINSGHFGLSYEAYTHFTSPIRRYPDLLVHRVIKALLAAGRYKLVLPPVVSSTSTFGGRGGKGGKTPPGKAGAAHAALPIAPKKVRAKVKWSPEEAQAWEVAGVHCSVNERRADEASRDVEAWLKCMFMRERLGEDYGGTVSTVASFGLFVQLDNLFVEGLIHITELGGDYYKFDEVRQELRGERTGVRYKVGDRVRVQVSRVDLDSRKIDFCLVRDTPVAGAETMGRRRNNAPRDASKGSGSAQSTLDDVRFQDHQVKQSAKKAVKKGSVKSAKLVPQARGSGKTAGKAAGRPKASRRT